MICESAIGTRSLRRIRAESGENVSLRRAVHVSLAQRHSCSLQEKFPESVSVQKVRELGNLIPLPPTFDETPDVCGEGSSDHPMKTSNLLISSQAAECNHRIVIQLTQMLSMSSRDSRGDLLSGRFLGHACIEANR